MCIPVKHLPDDIMEQFNLASLVVNGHVMVEIRKGMYGLPQAGLLAQQRLNAHLHKFGYTKYKHTPALYTHHTCPITFTLIVDDFGIEYHSKKMLSIYLPISVNSMKSLSTGPALSTLVSP